MMNILDALCLSMIEYYRGDPKRIQHFLKVHDFARMIGECEGLVGKELLTLEAAAYVHDIGIKPAEQKYGRCDGPLQEKEGILPAEKMLTRLYFDPEIIDRVCYLVGHHHTYTDIDGSDWQILAEADFLVNLFEDGVSRDGILSAYERIFRTETGKELCRILFDLPENREQSKSENRSAL